MSEEVSSEPGCITTRALRPGPSRSWSRMDAGAGSTTAVLSLVGW